MARADTVPILAESVVGGIAAFSHPTTCGMAIPRPLLAWPGLLTANMVLTAGSVHALPRRPHAQQTCDTTHNTRDLPTSVQPPTSTLSRRTSSIVLCDSSPSEQQQPESASVRASNQQVIRDPVEDTDQELEIRRIAHQLRTIGDEFNVSLRLRMRVHRGQHWRLFYRGLLDFVTQTLTVLYRLT